MHRWLPRKPSFKYGLFLFFAGLGVVDLWLCLVFRTTSCGPVNSSVVEPAVAGAIAATPLTAVPGALLSLKASHFGVENHSQGKPCFCPLMLLVVPMGLSHVA